MDPQLTPPRPPVRPEASNPPLPPRPVAVPPRAATPESVSTPPSSVPIQQNPSATVPAPTKPVIPNNQPPLPSSQNLPLPNQTPRPIASAPLQPPPATPTTAAAPSSAEILSRADKDDRKRSLFGNLRTLLSLVVFVGTVIVAAMLINSFIFQSYYVDGTSMTPTLQNEDRLIIDKVGKTTALLQGKSYIPKRGDIVVLDSSILDQYGHEEQLVKRVIGLPGDTLHIQDGVVTIKNNEFPDGFNVDEQLGLDLAKTYSESPIEVTIPEGNVFVLGDNRGPNGSFDSRSFGLVKSDNIQGRLSMRIFPFNTTRVF